MEPEKKLEVLEKLIKEVCKNQGLVYDVLLESIDKETETHKIVVKDFGDPVTFFAGLLSFPNVKRENLKLLRGYFLSMNEYISELKKKIDLMQDISNECEKKLNPKGMF